MLTVKMVILRYHGSGLIPLTYAEAVRTIFTQCPPTVVVQWWLFDLGATARADDPGTALTLEFTSSQVQAIRERARSRPGVPPDHIPVAFVRTIRPPRGLWGMGMLPPAVAGYTHAGICAVADPPAGGARLPHVLAHEIGHWFLGPGHVGDRQNLMWQDPNTAPHATHLTTDQCRMIRGKHPNPGLRW